MNLSVIYQEQARMRNAYEIGIFAYMPYIYSYEFRVYNHGELLIKDKDYRIDFSRNRLIIYGFQHTMHIELKLIPKVTPVITTTTTTYIDYYDDEEDYALTAFKPWLENAMEGEWLYELNNHICEAPPRKKLTQWDFLSLDYW